jgi:hypothetical protein
MLQTGALRFLQLCSRRFTSREMLRFVGHFTVTAISNSLSAFPCRIKRSSKDCRDIIRLWSWNKINSEDQVTITALKETHFLIMKVKCKLCRKINLFFLFRCRSLSVRCSQGPSTLSAQRKPKKRTTLEITNFFPFCQLLSTDCRFIHSHALSGKRDTFLSCSQRRKQWPAGLLIPSS